MRALTRSAPLLVCGGIISCRDSEHGGRDELQHWFLYFWWLCSHDLWSLAWLGLLGSGSIPVTGRYRYSHNGGVKFPLPKSRCFVLGACQRWTLLWQQSSLLGNSEGPWHKGGRTASEGSKLGKIPSYVVESRSLRSFLVNLFEESVLEFAFAFQVSCRGEAISMTGWSETKPTHACVARSPTESLATAQIRFLGSM